MKSEAASARPFTPSTIDWTGVRNVLLIRLRSIGDTVLMTPCLQALNEWQPAVEIGVVIEPLSAPVIEGHPLVQHLFIAEKSFSSRLALARQLRRERFDVAINLHGGTTGMLLAAMSGARYKVGYRDQRSSWLLTDHAPAPDVILGRKRIHSVEQQLALLHWAGVPMPEQPKVSLENTFDAAARVREKLVNMGLEAASLISGRFAIVAPGAAFESKRWSNGGFAAVVQHLSTRWRIDSIVLAGPGQERLAHEVANSSQTGARVVSNLSVAELKALIAIFGRVFVGNDSGPMHIAAAFDCPVVALFGSSNPDVWHPWTRASYRTLGGESGVADSDVRGSIDSITVDEVISAVDEVLQASAAQTVS